MRNLCLCSMAGSYLFFITFKNHWYETQYLSDIRGEPLSSPEEEIKILTRVVKASVFILLSVLNTQGNLVHSTVVALYYYHGRPCCLAGQASCLQFQLGSGQADRICVNIYLLRRSVNGCDSWFSRPTRCSHFAFLCNILILSVETWAYLIPWYLLNLVPFPVVSDVSYSSSGQFRSVCVYFLSVCQHLLLITANLHTFVYFYSKYLTQAQQFYTLISIRY